MHIKFLQGIRLVLDGVELKIPEVMGDFASVYTKKRVWRYFPITGGTQEVHALPEETCWSQLSLGPRTIVLVYTPDAPLPMTPSVQ